MQNKLLLPFITGILLLSSASCSVEPEDSTRKVINPSDLGEIVWDPSLFSSIPDDVPLKMSMETREENFHGQDFLLMELHLYNPSTDSLYLTARGGTDKLSYDFVVIQMDSLRVWNRRPGYVINSNFNHMILKPGEQHTFEEIWDYTNYDGEPLESGTYLIYGGIQRLSISENERGKNRINLFNDTIPSHETNAHVGAGIGPDTLIINNP
jgi:hypothetical protein